MTKKYEVQITETVITTIYVTADSPEEAETEAMDVFMYEETEPTWSTVEDVYVGEVEA